MEPEAHTASEEGPEPGDAEALRVWRSELDRLNREIVERVQARARLVREVARLKLARGLPPLDARREAEMLEALLRTPGEGFSREELARLLRVAMRFYRRLAVAPDGP